MAAGLLIGGLVLGAIGTGVQINAANKAEAAQNQEITAQQNAEAIRNESMRVDADQKRRAAIRQSIIQRSQAVSSTTSQGAQFGSALPGAEGQIAGQTNLTLSGIGTSETLGNQAFGANQAILTAKRAEAAAGTEAAIGSGLSSLGGKAMSAGPAFGRLTASN